MHNVLSIFDNHRRKKNECNFKESLTRVGARIVHQHQQGFQGWSKVRVIPAVRVFLNHGWFRYINPSVTNVGKSGIVKIKWKAESQRGNESRYAEPVPTSDITVSTCAYCKNPGHVEENYWKKFWKEGSKKHVLIRRGWHLSTTPIATLLHEDKALTINCIIDSWADVSILRNSVATKLDVVIKSVTRALRGLVTKTIDSLGSCIVVAILQAITLKIEFFVVPDKYFPTN